MLLRFGLFRVNVRQFSTSLLRYKFDLNQEQPLKESQAAPPEQKLPESITIRGRDVPEPVYDFTKTGFPEQIVERLCKDYDKPTIIQSISWPVAMSGRDLISVAQTGSGKTLGFILPGIVHTLNVPRRPPGGGPSVLVLAPTRELAQQVHQVTRQFAPILQRNSTCVFGGSPRHTQEPFLQRGVDICVATPGRLLDFLASGSTNLNRCTYLVLDEADRMLDMGFEPQIRQIITQIKSNRQTLMFSATWPEEVRSLANDFQSDPVFMNVGSLEISANHNIKQNIEIIEPYDKQKRLFDLLNETVKQKNTKVLVFCQTKNTVDFLVNGLSRAGLSVTGIHGGKTQARRDAVLQDFKFGHTSILIATDVAARGLHVDDISLVINYDFPNTIEDYVHRIGRTGRCGNEGVACTFFTPMNMDMARDLVRIMEEAKQDVPDKLRAWASSSSNRGKSGNRSQFGGYGRPFSYRARHARF